MQGVGGIEWVLGSGPGEMLEVGGVEEVNVGINYRRLHHFAVGGRSQASVVGRRSSSAAGRPRCGVLGYAGIPVPQMRGDFPPDLPPKHVHSQAPHASRTGAAGGFAR